MLLFELYIRHRVVRLRQFFVGRRTSLEAYLALLRSNFSFVVIVVVPRKRGLHHGMHVMHGSSKPDYYILPVDDIPKNIFVHCLYLWRVSCGEITRLSRPCRSIPLDAALLMHDSVLPHLIEALFPMHILTTHASYHYYM